MAFENFPYTDFHNLNLDWMLSTVKDLNTKWDDYYQQWNKWQKDVQNYIDSLDYISAINAYLDGMVDSGQMADIVDGIITDYGVICIGDSYGQGYNPDGNVTPWITILKNSYFNDAKFFKSNSAGGAGFGATGQNNYKFEGLLSDSIKTLTAKEKKQVKYVIVAGGWNDQFVAGSLVTSGISNTVKLVKDNLPNATLYIGWIATPIIGLTTLAKRKAYWDTKTLYQSAWKGYKYLSGADLAMRWISLVGSDKIHPNATGQGSIADCIYKAIEGNCEIERHATFNMDGVGCTLNNYGWDVAYNGKSCNITTRHVSGFLDLAFSPTINLSNTPKHVMNHSITFLNETAVATCKAVIHHSKGYTSTVAQLIINPFDTTTVDSGHIYLQVVDAVTNGYVTYENVDEIQLYQLEWNVMLY